MILLTRFHILLEIFGEKIYVLANMKIETQCIQKQHNALVAII
jgi:hypothetical protein